MSALPIVFGSDGELVISFEGVEVASSDGLFDPVWLGSCDDFKVGINEGLVLKAVVG